MINKKESFFWTSYSDLMTSLFFIMMVLFVLVMVLLYKRMEATETQLAEIKKVEQSTKDLSTDYFEYNEQYQKYVLKINVFFPQLVTSFNALSSDCLDSLKNAGVEIKHFLDNHSENKYLLIIEGQASRNSEGWRDRNYDLSFLRAENLMKYWLIDCKIGFPDNVEVQIAGSGDGRLNINSMRDRNNIKNQRFLIHIIPKNIFKE